MRKAEGCDALRRAEIVNIEGAFESLQGYCEDESEYWVEICFFDRSMLAVYPESAHFTVPLLLASYIQIKSAKQNSLIVATVHPQVYERHSRCRCGGWG